MEFRYIIKASDFYTTRFSRHTERTHLYSCSETQAFAGISSSKVFVLHCNGKPSRQQSWIYNCRILVKHSIWIGNFPKLMNFGLCAFTADIVGMFIFVGYCKGLNEGQQNNSGNWSCRVQNSMRLQIRVQSL